MYEIIEVYLRILLGLPLKFQNVQEHQGLGLSIKAFDTIFEFLF